MQGLFSPTGSRRVIASKRPNPLDAVDGTLAKLRRRELGEATRIDRSQEQYKRLDLQAELDTHCSTSGGDWELPLLTQRSGVVEVFAKRGIVVALTKSGVCSAFLKATGERLCVMNIRPDQIVRSLYYNRLQDSLITVSVYGSDDFGCLRCHSTPLEALRQRKPEAAVPLVESERLNWPGFVEFDDVNGVMITFNPDTDTYKVFSLRSYEKLWETCDATINEIKISPDVMVLICRSPPHVHRLAFKVLHIASGALLRNVDVRLKRGRGIDCVEIFNEKLLVKQEGCDLRIIDIVNGAVVRVPQDQFPRPSLFIFLHEANLFMTLREHELQVWNFRGERVAEFADHTLQMEECSANDIYISSDHSIIISACRSNALAGADADAGGDDPEPSCGEDDELASSINVSAVRSGRSVARLTAAGPDGKTDPVRVRALTDVTALYFDEDACQLYTATSAGLVHRWGLGQGPLLGL